MKRQLQVRRRKKKCGLLPSFRVLYKDSQVLLDHVSTFFMVTGMNTGETIFYQSWDVRKEGRTLLIKPLTSGVLFSQY